MTKRVWLLGLIIGSGLFFGVSADAQVVPSELIPEQYIITLKDDVVGANLVAKAFAAANGGTVVQVYSHALNGFTLKIPKAAADVLRKNPLVASVEQDAVVHIATTQSSAPWGLDRIDQRTLPLSSSYTYNSSGTGVHAYVIDTGLRASHSEFAGRVGSGFTVIKDGRGTGDCNGHGTHVAGTIGGTLYGVAKDVTLHPVRALDCGGSGTWSGVIAAIDWVTANHTAPAVANLSLGGSYSQTVNNAVQNSIASGVVYVVAAGNSSADACNYSPASTPEALTVGASQATNPDSPASFSNKGQCLDLYAPGNNITSAWYTSNSASKVLSGTSMAAPHAAGVAALYLADNPSASPGEVMSAVVANATAGALSNLSAGSPNKLLFALFGSSASLPAQDPEPEPTPDPVSPFTVDVSVSAGQRQAVVEWESNHPSTGTVVIRRWGLVVQTLSSNTNNTNHSVTAAGLSRRTSYSYELTTTSSDTSEVKTITGTFRTR